MPNEDAKSLAEFDFENLPPLVPAGGDRQGILDEIVGRWATMTQDSLREQGLLGGFSGKNHPATLKYVDLRDDNPGAEPIDLGDLLRSLQSRLLLMAESGSDTPSLPKAIVSIHGCRIRRCQCKKLNLSSHLLVSLCYFDEFVDFREAVICGNVQLLHIEYAKRVDFTKAILRGTTLIVDNVFNDKVIFYETNFDFISTDFVNFSETSHCSFSGSKFHRDTNFRNAVFANLAAIFGGATFSDSVQFGGATFVSGAWFHNAIFLGKVQFGEATFLYGSKFDGADLRRAKITPSTNNPVQRDHFWRRWRLQLTDWLNWGWVRKTGELTALTRVSYLALVVVPILAGLWGPMRGWIASQNDALSRAGVELNELLGQAPAATENIQEWQGIVRDLTHATLPEVMPTSWLLAFLAAFAIVLAQLVYQTRCPELVRRNSVDKLIDEASETNRRDGDITQERLRQAVDFLHLAADAMPHRHNAWFVKRERRTVWIPNVLNQFANATVDELKQDDAGDDWAPAKKVEATDQEVDAEDRKRIAIEEGQKARYAFEAFRNRSAAWVSGGLYILGGWFLLLIVMRQLGNIAGASAAPWLGYLVDWSRWGWLIVVVAVLMILITTFGAVLVNGAVSERLDKWFESRMHVKRMAAKKQP